MTEQADETEGVAETGRAAVRLHLITPLQQAGLRRPPRVTVEALDDMLARLVTYLAYMSPANLATLAETCINNAGGARHDEWPSEVLIRSWAHGLQARPFEEHRIVASWLASVEGPVAEAGGWLVELYRYLRRRQIPPSPYDQTQMRREAQDNARRIILIRERIAVEKASPEERGWLEAYLADQRRAEAIVDQGKTKRLAPVPHQVAS
jgi:hypothetical protein